MQGKVDGNPRLACTSPHSLNLHRYPTFPLLSLRSFHGSKIRFQSPWVPILPLNCIRILGHLPSLCKYAPRASPLVIPPIPRWRIDHNTTPKGDPPPRRQAYQNRPPPAQDGPRSHVLTWLVNQQRCPVNRVGRMAGTEVAPAREAESRRVHAVELGIDVVGSK